jgi:ParB family chromosome partitioning protein
MAEQKLGKGLGALFGGLTFDDEGRSVRSNNNGGDDGIKMIAVSQIDNNVDQPRKAFDKAAMEELTDSIKAHGVLQPILVTPVGSRYMIVAGERRWRASKLAGLKEIPAVVKLFNVKQIAEIAIVENLQRDDLNDMELALGIKKLMGEHSLTQEKVAERIGKPRSTVANMLRLTTLPEYIQGLIAERKLTYGHAIRLLTVPNDTDKCDYAKTAVVNDLSVRALGDLIDGTNSGGKLFNVKQFVSFKKDKPIKPIEIREEEKALSKAMGTRVKIDGTAQSGKVVLIYYSADELYRITEILKQHKISSR